MLARAVHVAVIRFRSGVLDIPVLPLFKMLAIGTHHMLNCQPKVMTIYETAALIGGYTIEDPGKRGTLKATFSLNPGHGIDVHERPF